MQASAAGQQLLRVRFGGGAEEVLVELGVLGGLDAAALVAQADVLLGALHGAGAERRVGERVVASCGAGVARPRVPHGAAVELRVVGDDPSAGLLHDVLALACEVAQLLEGVDAFSRDLRRADLVDLECCPADGVPPRKAEELHAFVEERSVFVVDVVGELYDEASEVCGFGVEDEDSAGRWMWRWRLRRR